MPWVGGYSPVRQLRELCGGCTSGKGSRQKMRSHGLRKESTRKLLDDLHDKRGTPNVDKMKLGRTRYS